MRISWVYLCLIFFVFLVGCGGATSATPDSGSGSTSTISVSPTAIAVSPGQSVKFQAMETGASTTINWAVNGIIGGNTTVGTIDASGNYTAPATTQGVAVTITATAASVPPSPTESAQVYVVAPGVVAPTANPQVALYTIAPPAAASVTIQFGPTTAYGKSTWTQTSPAGGGSVGTYVAGMLANTPYHMQATVQFPGGITYTDADHAFTTGTLPAGAVPSSTATTTAGATPQGGVELLDLVSLTPSSKVGVAATDLSGNVVWTYNPGSSVPAGSDAEPVKLLPNGHMLANFVVINNTGVALSSVLQEVDLAGNVIWQLSTAQLNAALASATCAECNVTILATHHDIAILPNGHLIVIADTTQVVSGVTVYGDVII